MENCFDLERFFFKKKKLIVRLANFAPGVYPKSFGMKGVGEGRISSSKWLKEK